MKDRLDNTIASEAGNPQLSIGSRTDNPALIDHGTTALRHQKLSVHISSFLSFQLLNHRCKCLIKVLRMEPRQLKLKTRNPVGQKYYQQLEGTSSRNFQLSVLSLHRTSNKVFGMSNYINQESVAKHEQQLIDYKAFHFSSTLSTEVFYEGSRHLDRNSEKHSIAIIRANTDKISRSSSIRKWREHFRMNISLRRECWSISSILASLRITAYSQLYSDICIYLIGVYAHACIIIL